MGMMMLRMPVAAEIPCKRPQLLLPKAYEHSGRKKHMKKIIPKNSLQLLHAMLTAEMKAMTLPTDFRVICSVCGDSRLAATDFAPAQLRKKHPRCRACAPNKFSNQASGGHQSKRESRAAINLPAVYGAALREQVSYELIPRQLGTRGKVIERACTYIADFVYPDDEGTIHVVDAKGHRTDVYRIKKKLMLKVHGIRLEEI